MANIKKLIGLLVLIALTFAQAGMAQNQTQTITRMFSYDPHPSTADFSSPVSFNGELLKHQLVFHETWKTIKDTDYLQTINFTLQALKGTEVVAKSSTKPFDVKKISKGQSVGDTRLGDATLTVSIEDFVKSGAGITDLTLVFKLESSQATAGQTQEQPANPPDSGEATVAGNEPFKASLPAADKSSAALYFCRKLAERAAELPADNVIARLSLLKKALAAAPLATSSSEAADFRNQISQLIQELEKGHSSADKKSAAGSSEPDQNTPELTTIQTPPSQTKPVTTVAKKVVDPAAKELYNRAKTLLSEDKGPEGREALRKALEIAPDYSDALILLGDNAYSNRKYSRAKEAFEKVITIDDRDADTLLKYFKACYYLGEGSEAILKLAAAKEKFPADTGIKFSTSEAYFQLGDLINAEAVCNEILAVSPDNYRAKDLIKRIKSHLK